MKKSLFLYFVLCVVLVSCADKKKEMEVITPNKLYERAMNNLKKNKPNEAAKDFERLEAENPFSEYSSKSIIMAAYSYYHDSEYDDSLSVVNYIKKTSFENLDYIFYLEVLNKYEKFKKAKKDLDLAKDLYKTICTALEKFPTSIYVDDLKEKKEMILENITKKEFNIVKLYIKEGNLIGSINHLREILGNYPDNKYTPQALYTMYALYKHIGYDFGIKFYNDLLRNKYSDSQVIKYLN